MLAVFASVHAPVIIPLNRTKETWTGEHHNPPSLPPETFFGLPGVFADTLPDDFGNAVINAWLARKGIPKSSFSPVDRLLYTGNRGMGGWNMPTT